MEKTIETIKKHFQALALLLNEERPIENFSALRKSIESYSFYLKKYEHFLTVDLKITSNVCVICSDPIKNRNNFKSIRLNCSHLVCSNACLSSYIIMKNPDLYTYENTACPCCFKYITAKILVSAFGDRPTLDKLIVDQEEKRAAKFNCPICSEELRVDHGITLDCDHRYCRKCLAMQIEFNLSEAKVSEQELSCPECMFPIANMILKELLSRGNFNKLERFRLRNYSPDEENIVFFKCPGIDCEYFVILGEEDEIVKCPVSKVAYCPKCRKVPHLKKTCEEFDQEQKELREKALKEQKEQKDKALDDEFLIAAEALGFKTCPHCKSMCEKIDGCKFMRCFSKQCAGRNNFCLLCEKPLTEKQHYTHYKNKGPYGEICNFLDGTPDVYLVLK